MPCSLMWNYYADHLIKTHTVHFGVIFNISVEWKGFFFKKETWAAEMQFSEMCAQLIPQIRCYIDFQYSMVVHR